MKSKEKGFVLPSTLFAIVVIMIYSILILTFVASMNLNVRLQKISANNNIKIEQIYSDFILDNLSTAEGAYGGAELLVFGENGTTGEDIRALVALKKDNGGEITPDTVLCFIIRNFSKNSTICYQKCDFLFDIDETGNLIYGDDVSGLSFALLSDSGLEG